MKIVTRGLKVGITVATLVLMAACGGEAGGTAAAPDSTGSAQGPTEASAAGTTLMTRDTELGTVLTDPAGLTLYTFDKDTPGMSACVDECEVNWPPVAGDVTEPDGSTLPAQLTTITRPDGSAQTAYDGKPLYTFVQDTEPGQTTGDGVMEVWHAVVVD